VHQPGVNIEDINAVGASGTSGNAFS